jgi:hypothetical protein
VYLQVPPGAQRATDPRRKYYPTVTILPFLHACGVPMLSQCVQQEPISSGTYFGTTLDRIVRNMIPSLQRWIRSNMAEEYETIKQRVLPLLEQFRVYVVDELSVILSLGQHVARVEV